MQNRVFLSYQHESFAAISQLADELRFRGIVPWVDKLPGGFKAGDHSEREARRVIQEESSAFVLYLTEKVLCSDFIRCIEIPEARLRQRRDPSYPLVVVSPDYRFGALRTLTKDHFGVDLTPAHGYAREEAEALEDFWVRVSRQILHRHMHDLPRSADTFTLSVNTYERMALMDEGLYIDATHALDGDVSRADVWERLLAGMQDAKREVSNRFGRPRLIINGSKHLTAAFMTGRVFNQYPLDIRQKDEYWTSDAPIELLDSFVVDYHPGAYTNPSLSVEIATGHKDIAAGVDTLITSGQLNPGGRLRIRPTQGRVNVTGSISRSLAHVAYSAIDEATNAQPTNEIHLFAAAPQAFLMTLGTLFQGMPENHLYEWTADGYIESLVVPSRLR